MRARTAADLVANGVPRAEAMIKAGYSHSYANQGACVMKSGKLPAVDMLIRSAKEKYITQFVKTALKVMPGNRVAKRLSKSVFAPDNTESTAAIKEQNRMMARAEHTANASTVNVGVFIVPAEAAEWEQNARKTGPALVKAKIIPAL